MGAVELEGHEVLPYEAWFEAHKAHLEKEKAFTHYRARLAEERRALPWLKISKGLRVLKPRVGFGAYRTSSTGVAS